MRQTKMDQSMQNLNKFSNFTLPKNTNLPNIDHNGMQIQGA